MDGQILANSLMSLKGTDLKMVYVLLCKMNFGHLLTSKTRDLFSKENIDHFSKYLLEEVKKIEHKDDAAIQVDLLLEMEKLLKLRGTHYTTQKEIADQCTAIIQAVYELFQKQDKQFRVFTESENDSTQLQQMVQFQMGKVFRKLDDSFQDFSNEDQKKFSSQVNEYIYSLPEDEQNKIKEKLGIEDLTDEIIRMSIMTSGTSAVFTIIAEVSGFTFYTTTTSLVATFPGMFGLTLPIGFYTGITSTIAVLSNPLFLIPLLLGGGVLLVSHQNKSLRNKVLPIILLQIALPYMSKEGDEVQFEPFFKEWERRFNKYKKQHVRLGKIENDRIEVSTKINQHDKTIKSFKLQIDGELEKIRAAKQQIKYALKMTNFDTLNISPSFNLHKNEYSQVLTRIRELDSSQQNEPVESNLIRRIGSQLKNLTKPLDIKDEENKLDMILDSMVEDILHSKSPFTQDERDKIQYFEGIVQQLLEVKNAEEAEKHKLETRLKSLDQKRAIVSRKINELEKENEALADLYFSNESLQ